MLRPYFQIVGELFLDNFSDDLACTGPWAFLGCAGARRVILPVVIAIYVMITNVLLLNLMIAVFNDTVCLLGVIDIIIVVIIIVATAGVENEAQVGFSSSLLCSIRKSRSNPASIGACWITVSFSCFE